MTAPFQSFPPLHDISRVPAGPVLVVAPHPDDEVIGCGGAMALHHRRGDAVHVVLVTGGEGGGPSDVRLDESRRAGASLGRSTLTCLGAADGAVAGAAGLAAGLEAVVARLSPRVVYAPSPFEMHADHVATLDLVVAALAGHPGAQLLLYEVNTEAMASFLLDITAVAAIKRMALTAFASQHDRVDLVAKVDARNRARTVNVDILSVTHAEAFMELSPGEVPMVLERLRALAAVLHLSDVHAKGPGRDG